MRPFVLEALKTRAFMARTGSARGARLGAVLASGSLACLLALATSCGSRIEPPGGPPALDAGAPPALDAGDPPPSIEETAAAIASKFCRASTHSGERFVRDCTARLTTHVRRWAAPSLGWVSAASLARCVGRPMRRALRLSTRLRHGHEDVRTRRAERRAVRRRAMWRAHDDLHAHTRGPTHLPARAPRAHQLRLTTSSGRAPPAPAAAAPTALSARPAGGELVFSPSFEGPFSQPLHTRRSPPARRRAPPAREGARRAGPARLAASRASGNRSTSGSPRSRAASPRSSIVLPPLEGRPPPARPTWSPTGEPLLGGGEHASGRGDPLIEHKHLHVCSGFEPCQRLEP